MPSATLSYKREEVSGAYRTVPRPTELLIAQQYLLTRMFLNPKPVNQEASILFSFFTAII